MNEMNMNKSLNVSAVTDVAATGLPCFSPPADYCSHVCSGSTQIRPSSQGRRTVESDCLGSNPGSATYQMFDSVMSA